MYSRRAPREKRSRLEVWKRWDFSRCAFSHFVKRIILLEFFNVEVGLLYFQHILQVDCRLSAQICSNSTETASY